MTPSMTRPKNNTILLSSKPCVALISISVLCASCSSPTVMGESVTEKDTPIALSNKALRPTSREGVVTAGHEGTLSQASTGEAKRELQTLLQLFARRDWSELETRAARLSAQLESLTPSVTNRSSLQASRNLQGMALLFLNRPLDAEPPFKAAFEQEQDPSIRPYYGYNLASALAESGKWIETRRIVESLKDAVLDRTTRVKLSALKARALAGSGAHAEAARAWLELQGGAGEMLESQLIREKLGLSLSEVSDPVILSALSEDFVLSKLGDELLWRAAEIERTLGNLEQGRAQLEKLISKFPNSPHAGDARLALRGNDGATAVTPRKIGALLPLTGKLSKYGKKALQALQLALEIYKPGDDLGGVPPKKSTLQRESENWTLVVEDSGEDEATALEGIRKLSEERGVSAIIGPLSSRGIESLGKKADALGVPLLTLSQQPANDAVWAFNGGLTAESQTSEIVRYAMTDLKLKRFAILHPRDRFGEEYARLFWDAVEKQGGEVRGIESYTPGETDFRNVIEKLGGLSWPEARRREIADLERQRSQLNITKRNMKTEKYYSLPPITDFEVVFIADEPRVAAQIIPTFAYRDMEGIKFLGSATWNSPELVARAQGQAEGAAFPDVFYHSDSPESGSLASSKFRTDYRATFNQEPQALDAIAHDAASILKNVLKGLPDGVRRAEIRDRLHNIGEFSGAAGKISSDEAGGWKRKLQILEVHGGKITLAR